MKLKFTIDRFESEYAILSGNDQSIIWPISLLPPDVAEGAVIEIQINADQVTESANQESAREILNEILNNK